MKTILITISHGAVAKNILRTDVIKTLVARPDIRVVCLMSSLEKADYYRKEIPHPRIIYDSFYKTPSGLFERLFGFLKFRLIRTETLDLWQRMSYDEHKNYMKCVAGFLFYRLISRGSVRRII